MTKKTRAELEAQIKDLQEQNAVLRGEAMFTSHKVHRNAARVTDLVSVLKSIVSMRDAVPGYSWTDLPKGEASDVEKKTLSLIATLAELHISQIEKMEKQDEEGDVAFKARCLEVVNRWDAVPGWWKGDNNV